MKTRTPIWQYFDVWLTTAVVLLTAYGVLIISSAITNTPGFVGFETRQIVFAFIGFGTMLVFAALDYRILTSAHWYIYFGLVGLLAFVLQFGTIQNSVSGWIDLGFIRVQPAEFARILITITLGQFIASRQHNMHRFSNTILTLIYIGIPIGMIFLQPDLGMSILFTVTWFGMMMLAGLPLRHFFVLLFVGIGTLIIVYPSLPEYQQARIEVFLDPESDPESDRNIGNAIVSIGSGGWFGLGFKQGTQTQSGFLRVQHTDFIFAVLTHEMGFFFGALVVVGLLGFILLRILRVASLTPDPAGRYICVGVATIIFFQTVVSIGMNLRLLPVTGLTLPFVSYGGSALLSLYIGIGLVQSVLMRHRKQAFG